MSLARLVQRGLVALIPAVLLLASAPALAQSGGEKRGSGKITWWLPESVSTYGGTVDLLFDIILWMTLIVGVAVFAVLAWFLVKYRYNPNRTATFIHGNVKLEIVWTLVPALLMAATAAISQSTWAKLKSPIDWTNEDDMAKKVQSGEIVLVEVVAQQFNWVVHYPGKDGKLGKRLPGLIEKGAPDTEIGLDRSDPASKDDIVLRTLVVPVNKKVFIRLSSVDVLHSFFLPNFRVKQDAVPGINGKVWFEATKLSRDFVGQVSPDNAVPDQINYFNLAKPYDIVCAELCGNFHSAMRGQLYVVTEEEYRNYIAGETKKQLTAPVDDSKAFE